MTISCRRREEEEEEQEEQEEEEEEEEEEGKEGKQETSNVQQGPPNQFLFMRTNPVKILLLRELLREQQLVMNPHAFASQPSKKSGTEQAH